jgi:predicted Zn finger-like uncharacterized protein
LPPISQRIMFTQCPYCLTVYEPTPEQLARGRGVLRCGLCERQFDALERLSNQPAATSISPIAAASAVPRIERPRGPEQHTLFELPSQDTPSFVVKRRPASQAERSLRMRTLWWAGSVVLCLALALQMVLAQRAELAENPRLRPALAALCNVLGCDLPLWRDASALQLLTRDVRPHPSVPDAMLISASFRNTAPWPQAWPVLELALSDLNGKTLALRRFQPDEYLGAAPHDATLRPGQSASATLEVDDPGKQAVAFAFDFR